MLSSLTPLLDALLKIGGLALVLNEVRGFVLAAPVLYGIYQTGGTLTAIWLGICSLGGIALSVIVPLVAARKLKGHLAERARRPASA